MCENQGVKLGSSTLKWGSKSHWEPLLLAQNHLSMYPGRHISIYENQTQEDWNIAQQQKLLGCLYETAVFLSFTVCTYTEGKN